MSEEKMNRETNEDKQQIQKKSEKDKSGAIGGLIFGILLSAGAYLIYDHFFRLLIVKIFVYIIVF